MPGITLPLQLALLLSTAIWWNDQARAAPNSRIEKATYPTKDELDDFYDGLREKRNTSFSDDANEDYDQTEFDDYDEPENESIPESLLVLFRKSATLGPANYTGVILTRDTAASIHIDDPTDVVGCPIRKTEGSECFGVKLAKEVRGVQYWTMNKPRDSPPQILARSSLLNFSRKMCKANRNSVEITKSQNDSFKCSPGCNEGEVIICGKQPVGIWKRSALDKENDDENDNDASEEYGQIIDLADLLAGLRSTAAPKPTAAPVIIPVQEKQQEAPKKSESEEKNVRTSAMANRIVISTLLLVIIGAWYCKFLS